MGDMGLRRLFRSPTDHLPVREQLRRCQTRDLKKTKLYNAAAKIWGAPRRKRVIVAPSMAFCKEKEPKLENSVCTREETPLGDDLDVADYRKWMGDRRRLRESLDGLHLDERWLRMKENKTELERRVLEKMTCTQEEQPVNRKPSVQPKLSPVDKKRSLQSRKPPQLQLPLPEAMAIIDNFLKQNCLRLVDLFSQFDKNKDWHVSEAEFRYAIQLAKMPITEQQLENLILALDRNEDGMLDYKELVRGRKSLQAVVREQKKGKEEKIKRDSSIEEKIRHDSSIEERISRASTASVESELARFSVSSAEEAMCPSPVSRLSVPDVALTETIELTEEQRSEMKSALRAKKQEKQRAKQLRLRQGKIEAARRSVTFSERVDRHLAPSTVRGPTGQVINDMRHQLKREYDESVNLCRMHGVKLTRELLEKALLYPGDHSVHKCKSGLKSVGTGLLSCNFAVLTEEDAPVDRRRFRRLSSYPSEGSTPATCPSRMKLSTGWAVIGAKTDCWMTFEEYEGLTRHLNRKFKRQSFHPAKDAFWPGSLLDKLRLLMPNIPGAPSRKTQSVDNIYHPIDRSLRNQDSLRPRYLESELWPMNDAGYIQHGGRHQRKQYQL